VFKVPQTFGRCYDFALPPIETDLAYPLAGGETSMDDKRAELGKRQAEQIENEIESLKGGHRDLYERRYREFFQHAKQISELFKEARAVPHLKRQRLWEMFSSLCDEVKRDEERSKESRASESRVKRGPIESNIREAHSWGKAARSVAELRQGEELLAKAAEQMKDGWSGFTWTTELTSLTQGRLTKEDRDDLWAQWRAAKEEIRSRRKYLSDLNYEHMRDVAETCLGLAHTDPREAKKRIKDAQADMKQRPMEKDQFSNIREMLDRAWETATDTASHKYEEWRQRMEGHVERWMELTEKNEEIIRRLEEQVEDCEAREATAKTDEFAERVRGWIEEKLDKIRDIRESNRELEDKIESAKKKLST
jgi:hypothetical protein